MKPKRLPFDLSRFHAADVPQVAAQMPLPADSAHYVSRVLRAQLGDVVELFDPSTGASAAGTITKIAGDEVVLAVQVHPTAAPLQSSPVVWIQAIPKGEKLDAIVRDATELGATDFIAVSTARSLVRLDEGRKVSRLERLEKIAAEASRQCGRVRAPNLTVQSSLEQALEQAALLAATLVVLVPHARCCLRDAIQSADERKGISFLAGPEGGLSPEEVTRTERYGGQLARLGHTVLRTETAVAAVLGALSVLRDVSQS